MSSKLNLMPEEELILLCARTSQDKNSEIRIKRLIKSEINWEQIVYIASSHGLKPLLYFNLKNYADQITFNISILKDFYLNNTHKNLFFLGEMMRILHVFEKNNITAIPYKGSIMAINGYGNLAFRQFGDIDLYINKKDINKIKEILKNEDYRLKLDIIDSNEEYYLKSQRELKFIKDNLIIETQWNVVGISFSYPDGNYFPLDHDLKHLIVNNNDIRTFSDEDLILILSLHVAGHLWGRLSWLCDLAELIKNTEKINWQKVMDKAHFLAIDRILYLNLSLINKLFEVELPDEVRERIFEDPVIDNLEKDVLKNIFTPDKFSFLERISLRFKMRERPSNRFKDVIRTLFIPTYHDFSDLTLPKPLYFLYYIIRPFLLFRRYR